MILYGFITTAFVPLLLMILIEIPEVESKYIGSVTGTYYCISEIGGFSAPLIIGLLVDATGAFHAGVIFLAVSSVIISALSLFIKIGPPGKGD